MNSTVEVFKTAWRQGPGSNLALMLFLAFTGLAVLLTGELLLYVLYGQQTYSTASLGAHSRLLAAAALSANIAIFCGCRIYALGRSNAPARDRRSSKGEGLYLLMESGVGLCDKAHALSDEFAAECWIGDVLTWRSDVFSHSQKRNPKIFSLLSNSGKVPDPAKDLVSPCRTDLKEYYRDHCYQVSLLTEHLERRRRAEPRRAAA